MINNLILVGKVISLPEIVETKDQIPTKWAKFILGVERPFKNHLNEYEIDYISIKTWHANCQEIKNFFVINSVIGVKGRIQTFTNKNNDFHFLEVIADKLIYIE